jgi:hypothetical protein
VWMDAAPLGCVQNARGVASLQWRPLDHALGGRAEGVRAAAKHGFIVPKRPVRFRVTKGSSG